MEITSSRISVYEVVVDLKQWGDPQTSDLPGFTDALIDLLPSTKHHKCLSGKEGGFHREMREGTNLGHVIEHVLLELIHLAFPDGPEYTGWTRDRGNGEYVIHYGAPEFLTGRLAATFAVEIVQQLHEGMTPDLGMYLMHMRSPFEFFSRKGRIQGVLPATEESLLADVQADVQAVERTEEAPALADWQRRDIVALVGRICSRFDGVRDRWQSAFMAFGGEFGCGILDKVELLNPDCFSRQLLAGNIDAYFQGVANLSSMLKSLEIPLNFLTHSAWLFKNELLLTVIETEEDEPQARSAAVANLDDFYMNVLQAIRDGYERTDLPVERKDEVQLLEFRARRVRKGLVLVVDDDAMSRDVARDILEYNDFSTLGAQDGIEALRVLAENRDSVRAVVLDMVLPGLDGAAVARRILDGYPQTRLVLTSGYPAEEWAGKVPVGHTVRLLRKPYMSHDLLEAVRDLLDLSAASATACGGRDDVKS